MAGTLNDFLKECEMFPYSKENFEIIKEAAEINVAALYVENQTYMAENADVVASQEAGYMMESADEESVKSLKDNLKGKKDKWGAKAKAIWARIVKAFKTFWNAIVVKWTKLTAKAADVKKDLTAVTLTEEQSQAIRKLVLDSVTSSGIPLAEHQKSGYKGLPKNIIAGIKDETVKNKLAAVLYNNSIDLTISKESFGSALSDSQLKEFFNKLSDKSFLACNKGALANVVKKLEGYQTANLTKGISVSKNMEDVKKLIEFIEDAEKKITGEIVQDEDNGYTHAVGDVTTLFANAQKVTADSIKLYTTVVRYQEFVLNGLGPILKKAAPASKKEEE